MMMTIIMMAMILLLVKNISDDDAHPSKKKLQASSLDFIRNIHLDDDHQEGNRQDDLYIW